VPCWMAKQPCLAYSAGQHPPSNVKKVFTWANVSSVFEQWPQAVSMDDGDLRVLHDMANAGAQMWKERLPWPDYLWLDFNGELAVHSGPVEMRIASLSHPAGGATPASFPPTQSNFYQPQFPSSGPLRLSERAIAMIELKVIDTDLMSKLSPYKPKMAWPDFVQLKFKWFRKRLLSADAQIAGGKRLVPLGNPRGVAIFVNEASPNLPIDLVMSYFADAIKTLPNVDCIVYLTDRHDGRLIPQMAIKRDNDPLLKRFSAQLLMMFRSFDYTEETPVSRPGVQPDVVARIEMDARSRAMYRSWARGWRASNDARPLPSISMKISFVRRQEFITGLPHTEPDKALLDCHFAWDAVWNPANKSWGIANLRIVEPPKDAASPKALFPNIPGEVFEKCFQPLLNAYGWPFASVHDETEGTMWEKFFAPCSMVQWSKFKWRPGSHRLSISQWHPDTRMRSETILRAHCLGERNAASNTLSGRERFERLRAFVREHETLPVAMIGACTNEGIMILDGHIRLAVLMHLEIAEGIDLPMWLGISDTPRPGGEDSL